MAELSVFSFHSLIFPHAFEGIKSNPYKVIIIIPVIQCLSQESGTKFAL